MVATVASKSKCSTYERIIVATSIADSLRMTMSICAGSRAWIASNRATRPWSRDPSVADSGVWGSAGSATSRTRTGSDHEDTAGSV